MGVVTHFERKYPAAVGVGPQRFTVFPAPCGFLWCGSVVVHMPNGSDKTVRNCHPSRINLGRAAELVLVLALCRATAGSITGTWLVNGGKSSFGTHAAPERFSVRLERTQCRLAITEVTTDADGDHLSYRVFSVNRNGLSKEVTEFSPDTMVLRVISSHGLGTEEWRLAKTGELHIRRELVTPSGTTQQHLVLLPTATKRINQ